MLQPVNDRATTEAQAPAAPYTPSPPSSSSNGGALVAATILAVAVGAILVVGRTPESDARKRATLAGALGGFGIGFLLVQQGCGVGTDFHAKEVMVCSLAGGVLGILGALLGAVLGSQKK